MIPLVGSEWIADTCGKSRRTVEGWLLGTNGNAPVLRPEIVVSGRPLWREEAIRRWCEAGRPAGKFSDYTYGLDPIPDLIGVEDVADRCGRQVKTIRQWRFRDEQDHRDPPRLLPPDLEVAGVLLWLSERVERWECGANPT